MKNVFAMIALLVFAATVFGSTACKKQVEQEKAEDNQMVAVLEDEKAPAKPVSEVENSQSDGAQIDSGIEGLSGYEVPKSDYGKEVTCPVDKVKFKINEDTLAMKYKGKIYYFDKPDCIGPFEKSINKSIR